MRNWGGVGGVLFVVGILVTFSIFGDGPPENAQGAKEYYEDLQGVLAYAMMMAATVGLVWFASALHRVVGSVTATAALVTGAGMIVLSGATLIGIAESANELKGFSYDMTLIDVVETTSYFTITSAHALIGLGAMAAGFAMLRMASMPTWLAWFSIVAGALGLASVAFMPMMVVWAWVIVMGLMLVIRPTAADAVATTPAREREMTTA